MRKKIAKDSKNFKMLAESGGNISLQQK